MAFLYNIERTECIGNSLPKLNSNFTSLNEDVTVLSDSLARINTDIANLKISEEATRKYVGAPEFYKESSFTYGVNHYYGTPGLQDSWHDVFTNTNRDPLKIRIRIADVPKTVLLFGRVHLKMRNSTHTAWIRLARFNSMQRDSNPTEVLDIGSLGGDLYTDLEAPVPVQACYLLEPGVEYIFGLQTWFFWWKNARATANGLRQNLGDKTTPSEIFQSLYAASAPSSSIVVNGWQLDDSFTEQYRNTRDINNLADVQAINRSLEADTNVGDNRIGKNLKSYGYTYSEEALAKEIKNISFIRAVII